MPNPFAEYLRNMMPEDSSLQDGGGLADNPYQIMPDRGGLQADPYQLMPDKTPGNPLEFTPMWQNQNAAQMDNPVTRMSGIESPRGQAAGASAYGRTGVGAAGGFLAAPASGPVGQELVNYIREAAAKRNILPEIALEIANREGGTDKYEGNTGQFKTGRSHWAYQLHYGGEGTPYASWGNTAGMGNDFTSRTGFQPGDPGAWRAAVDFALDHAARYGWGAWYGRQAQAQRGLREIGEWEGINGR